LAARFPFAERLIPQASRKSERVAPFHVIHKPWRLALAAPRRDAWDMGTKSRETIYGASVHASAERAAEVRRQADKLACEAWNKRMLAFLGSGPALARAQNRTHPSFERVKDSYS
jgi:hypothetical protein